MCKQIKLKLKCFVISVIVYWQNGGHFKTLSVMCCHPLSHICKYMQKKVFSHWVVWLIAAYNVNMAAIMNLSVMFLKFSHDLICLRCMVMDISVKKKVVMFER